LALKQSKIKENMSGVKMAELKESLRREMKNAERAE
jgi:hypothetical protein